MPDFLAFLIWLSCFWSILFSFVKQDYLLHVANNVVKFSHHGLLRITVVEDLEDLFKPSKITSTLHSLDLISDFQDLLARSAFFSEPPMF